MVKRIILEFEDAIYEELLRYENVNVEWAIIEFGTNYCFVANAISFIDNAILVDIDDQEFRIVNKS